MSTATNVDATAVNTIAWLSSSDTTIVVPVYQRQYRWDIGGCEQLLGDVRAVAASDDRHRHFIGSILSSESTAGDDSELVLIDGQQRITTLMLLVAALHDTVKATDADLAAELAQVLTHADRPGVTKLRPHRAWARVYESVILDERAPGDEVRESRFDDNYAFFRSQVRPEDARHIWSGLRKLEHVAITLGSDANAQQIFESLNSTGAPLLDHELIHNYVLMGLTHAEQTEIEDGFWLPIEENTAESIGLFWRHYLVMLTGRDVADAGGHAVYGSFREQFPRLGVDALRDHAAQWRAYSAIYRTLLDPSQEADPGISRQLAFINTFGRGTYPLVMRMVHDYMDGSVTKGELIGVLEAIQSLLLRRTLVGESNDRLVARLCRAHEGGADALTRAIARVMPSDERVRVAIKFGQLPHAAYVLGRLAGAESPAGLDVDHILPATPSDSWTGDGVREWADYSDDEQNSHRALTQTLGNLVLLEQPLAERAFGASFPEKRDEIYPRSRLPTTIDLAGVGAWNTTAIAERTARLTQDFLRVWVRPATVGIDDDGLTPILDAVSRRGWPRGWEREYEYVEYRGEHWEVYDVRYLFNRVFKRLWADSRDSVVAFSARRGGPIYDAQTWSGHWDTIAEGQHLYMGWDSKYMLAAVQGVLEEAGIAPEVFVKYSYIGAAMA